MSGRFCWRVAQRGCVQRLFCRVGRELALGPEMPSKQAFYMILLNAVSPRDT